MENELRSNFLRDFVDSARARSGATSSTLSESRSDPQGFWSNERNRIWPRYSLDENTVAENADPLEEASGNISYDIRTRTFNVANPLEEESDTPDYDGIVSEMRDSIIADTMSGMRRRESSFASQYRSNFLPEEDQLVFDPGRYDNLRQRSAPMPTIDPVEDDDHSEIFEENKELEGLNVKLREALVFAIRMADNPEYVRRMIDDSFPDILT